ncbi:uncharacterized protein PV09_03040 [Verruconis gallopava]|uniref:F-box domain-containing protein n=1 Tax=Verruconis gallopava TaxID=253628 RepID=A0A0D1XSY2_9PEZI|nr:uncharacterized protein PV09_03040 [Verruconis gallopava]KIW05836.1 hypothetical protein PV09_03040 [Verruconis gallopava]
MKHDMYSVLRQTSFISRDIKTAAQESKSDNNLPGFFKLPRELRDEIYGYVLASGADWIRPIGHRAAESLRASHGATRRFNLSSGNETWPFATGREYITTVVLDNSILMVNRQIHEEAKKRMLESNPVLLGCRYPESHEESECIVRRYPEAARNARTLAVYFRTAIEIVDVEICGLEILQILANRINLKSVRFLCGDGLEKPCSNRLEYKDIIKASPVHARLSQLMNIKVHDFLSVEFQDMPQRICLRLCRVDDKDILIWLGEHTNHSR